MPSSERLTRIVIAALLVIHALWLVNHMRWVAADRINPWKLGGYAMYTVPATWTTFAVMDISDANAPALLTTSDYDASGFVKSRGWFNRRRSFRCLHLADDILRVFFEDNPALAGVPILLYFSDREFVRDPVSVRYREQGRVEVKWDDAGKSFEYKSTFCGETKTGILTPAK